MNGVTFFATIPLLLALAAADQGSPIRQTGPIQLKSDDPVYELLLPASYGAPVPPEDPPRYYRSAGRESWARVSAILAAIPHPLKQNPAGITAEEMVPLISLPPGATWTFSRTKWKDLEIGVLEYRAVVNNLPVLGLSTILPLARKGLRFTVYAPDPLETEVREDFQMLLTKITRTESNWLTEEALRNAALLQKVTIAGGVLFWLYPIAWVIFFRGRPLAAHWLRTGWLLAIALLLFVPITSPAPTSATNNLVVNVLFPLIFVMLTVRRLKLGIDAD